VFIIQGCKHKAMKAVVGILLFLVLCFCWSDSFAQLWESVGGGCNREVRVLYADSVEDALLVGGSFRYAGGVEVNQIAKWDGQMWDDIGGGSGDTAAPGGPAILGIVRFEGDLFAGGFMQMMGGNAACRSLARWDGQSWNACGSPDAQVNLEVTNGKLFAMGLFQEIDGKPIPRLATWNGSEWQLYC
jgi:trimeric autotransporter adhesin